MGVFVLWKGGQAMSEPNRNYIANKYTGNPENYTPAVYIEAARRVLGEIDLDPASCFLAQETVKANRFFTKEENGLQQKWNGRVFLNPPYARRVSVVVISEKATVSGILRPALEEYGVPFMALHGYNSATKVYELAQEIQHDNRQHVFLYVGDYDCSGMPMTSSRRMLVGWRTG